MVRPTPNLGLLFSAIATPVTRDGGLDADVAARLAAQHVERGVEGLYCGGSSGEGLLLTPDERQRMLAAVVDGAAGAIPVVAHVGALSTREAITLAEHAQEVGAVAVSMIPPIYYKFTPEEVLAHYRAVMDAVDLPMIVYNIPQFTGQDIGAGDELLADERVVGVKYTAHSMYQLERISRHRPNLQLVNGFDEAYLASLVAGASGSIGTTISMQTDTFKAVRAHHDAGELAAARGFQRRINDVIEKLVDVGVFPAAKWVEAQLSGLELGPCRSPFAPVPPAAEPRLRELVGTIEANNEEARASLS
ncbi:dihydrodipicolinate synthase family protein [Tessaracoccus sp. OS52]|uniref:dihydrodipicolinate synthase family protein n=1 Tax=Tessaracoccus sp. OS52 TaxID=2886691 RepID=UPI001D109219|nr:dihydrodipicolinate synthase family protein [Tessaracoccus sp. OS52]MCC2594317.1 dihydrodipicolinate synthase family protein [Tessaracoccus sp. OS52]